MRRQFWSYAGKWESIRVSCSPIEGDTKAWKAALSRAGITEFRWHDLRHTWASWHVQTGTPLNALQELGGWESVDLVRRYAHLAPDHLTRRR
jgi:integrase